MSTIVPKGPFPAFGKCQPPLILLGLQPAFQADDEGSIPFTRSSLLAVALARLAEIGRQFVASDGDS